MQKALILNDSGLFSYHLGDIQGAETTFRKILKTCRGVTLREIVLQNLTLSLFTQGRLSDALNTTKKYQFHEREESHGLADLSRITTSFVKNMVRRKGYLPKDATASFPIVELSGGIEDGDHDSIKNAIVNFNGVLPNVIAGILELYKENWGQAQQIAQNGIAKLLEFNMSSHHDRQKLKLINAEAEFFASPEKATLQHYESQLRSVDEVIDWADKRFARVVRAWALAIKGRMLVQLAKYCHPKAISSDEYPTSSNTIIAQLNSSIEFASEHSFALYYIDLLLVRCEYNLWLGDYVEAICDSTLALDNHLDIAGGNKQRLPGASEEECGYSWGILRGHRLLAQAHLLKLANLIGSSSTSKGISGIKNKWVKSEAKVAIREIRSHLGIASRLAKRISPNSFKRIEKQMDDIKKGKWTKHPILTSSIALDCDESEWDGEFDAFVSFASEDRPFVESLVSEIEDGDAKVWFDQDQLVRGASLRESIDRGLMRSRHGIVILSKHYFEKEWTVRELDALILRDRLIPVLYGMTHEELRAKSELLAGRIAIDASSIPVAKVAKEICGSFRI